MHPALSMNCQMHACKGWPRKELACSDHLLWASISKSSSIDDGDEVTCQQRRRHLRGRKHGQSRSAALGKMRDAHPPALRAVITNATQLNAHAALQGWGLRSLHHRLPSDQTDIQKSLPRRIARLNLQPHRRADVFVLHPPRSPKLDVGVGQRMTVEAHHAVSHRDLAAEMCGRAVIHTVNDHRPALGIQGLR